MAENGAKQPELELDRIKLASKEVWTLRILLENIR